MKVKTIILLASITALFAYLALPASANLYVGPLPDSLTTGLVGYWTFDGADMNATHAFDKSGNGNNGTIGGATKAIGKIGQGMQFDGVYDNVTKTNPSWDFTANPAPSFSISAWLKPNSCSSGNGGISLCDDNLRIGRYGTGWFFNLRAGSTFASGGTCTIGRWAHIVGIYNSSDTKLYLYQDGILVGDSVPVALTDTSNCVDKLYIGYNQWYWNGSIDEVRVYNRVLSAAEIKRLYNMGAATKVDKTPVTSVTTGLVGYWTFDGADTNSTHAFDKSGNNNNGTLVNGTAKATGKIGQGAKFDGVDDFINAGSGSTLDNLNTSGMTVSAWIKPNTIGESGNGRIVSKSDRYSGSHGWRFSMFTGSVLQFWVEYGTDDTGDLLVFSSTTVPLKTWGYVTITWDGSTSATNVHIYINGAEASYSQQTSATGTYASDENVSLYIGNEPSLSRHFNGLIDDVRIYNRVLSADEILRLYNTGAATKVDKTPVTSVTTGLVGYWTFDGADMNATHAFDKSGQGNNGTIVGATKTIGKLGQGMSFDGSSSYVDAGTNDSLYSSVFTVSAWVKGSSPQTNFAAPFAKGNSVLERNFNYGCYYISGATTIRCFIGNDTTYQNTSNVIVPSNSWYHLVFSLDGSKLYVYINNVLVASPDKTLGGTIAGSGDKFLIGALTSPYKFKGLIDDVRVYNRSLSAEEIKRLYNMGR